MRGRKREAIALLALTALWWPAVPTAAAGAGPSPSPLVGLPSPVAVSPSPIAVSPSAAPSPTAATGPAEPPPTPPPRRKRDVIVVADELLEGWILARRKDGFLFRLAGSAATVLVRWKDLRPDERRRITGLLEKRSGTAEAAADDQTPAEYIGERIRGVRLHLRGGGTLVGVLMPEKEDERSICFRDRKIRELRLEKSKVVRREPVWLYEGAVYKPREIYRRHLDSRSPESAEDHLRFAGECSRLGLLHEAEKHLAQARDLGAPRGEPDRPRRGLDALSERRSRKGVLDSIRSAIAEGRYGDALRGLDDLELLGLDGMEARALLAQRKELIKLRDEHLQAEVILNVHRWSDALIRDLLARGLLVGEGGSGLRATLWDGRVVEGSLLKEDEYEVVLLTENTEYHIDRTDISELKKVTLNEKRKDPTFGEVLAYLSGADWTAFWPRLRANLATELGATEAEVEEEWQMRLRSIVRISGGQSTVDREAFYVKRTASYGTNTWAREKLGTLSGMASAAHAAPGPAPGPAGGGALPLEPAPVAANLSGLSSGELEEWWRDLRWREKREFLRALVAELHMDVAERTEYPCPRCRGKGKRVTVTIGGTGLDERKTTEKTCSGCRGVGHTTEISFR